MDTIDIIQQEVCKYYNINIELLISQTRVREVAIARHIAIYLCTIETRKSLKDIGDRFGMRTHATCINSINKAYKLKNHDDKFQLEILELNEIIHNSIDKFKSTKTNDVMESDLKKVISKVFENGINKKAMYNAISTFIDSKYILKSEINNRIIPKPKTEIKTVTKIQIPDNYINKDKVKDAIGDFIKTVL